jgi:hypothetical protein
MIDIILNIIYTVYFNVYISFYNNKSLNIILQVSQMYEIAGDLFIDLITQHIIFENTLVPERNETTGVELKRGSQAETVAPL